MKINSLYISVEDMKRAVNFYEQYFGKKVDRFDNRYSIFEINGFSFGLFNPKEDGEDVVFGNNIIPNIEVDNIDEEYKKIKDIGAKIILDIDEINNMKLFQFKDSEGNIIEVYSKISV